MPEPRIQYVKTSDGVNIAYAVFGTGPAIVFPSAIWGNIHLFKHRGVPRTYDDLVSLGWSVITYDGRGMGASDRNPDDWTLGARQRDLEAVVERAALEHFVLCGSSGGGPTAAAYAVAHPERVTHLVLSNTFSSGREWYEMVPAMRSSRDLEGMAEEEWEFYTRSTASGLLGHLDADRALKLAEAMRSAMTPRDYLAYRAATEAIDVSEMLTQLTVPTLVVYNKDSAMAKVGEVAQRVVRLVPDVRYVETEDLAETIDSFLREGGLIPDQGERKRPMAPGAFRTVLFTDLVGHTEMMSRLGDEAGRAVLREHERITREVLKAHNGAEIKTMGDGFMASFGSVTKAVECAVALQKAFDQRNNPVGAQHTPQPASYPSSAEPATPAAAIESLRAAPGAGSGDTTIVEPLHVRVGLNAGEPIEEDGDLFGATVILASRIASTADGGEILVADTVRGLCSGKGFLFADRGEFVAKGFEEPVRVYEVRWRE